MRSRAHDSRIRVADRRFVFNPLETIGVTSGQWPIGARLPRFEDPRLVRGHGQYVADLRFPGMAYVAFARCTTGPAHIVHLSLERARSLPGVLAVFGPTDLPVLGATMPTVMSAAGVEVRMPSPLAVEEVRYAGEPVAVVVADDSYRAADAALAVEAAFEPRPAVIATSEAMSPHAALVHSDVASNIAGDLSRGYGDVDKAFGDADVTICATFQAERAAGASMEPRAVAAQPGGGDGVAVTLWDSTQAPHVIRHGVAQSLGLCDEQVRVIVPDVGGGFGPKGRLYPEEVVVAALALHLDRPVLWQATRQEDLMATYQGRGLTVEAELAARADGTLLGLRARLIQDAGAYLAAGFVVPQSSAQHMLGPYRLPACNIEIVAVYTHKPPLTPLRGGGRELGVFVMERLLDRLARRLDQDPVVIRERNVLKPDDFPYDTTYPARDGSTVVYDSGDYPACLSRAREIIGYDDIRKTQPRERACRVHRGVAVTLFLESTGVGKETARVEVESDGRVRLTIGSPSNGQSHATTLPQICAARLGVHPDRITLVSGDTGAMDQGTGTFASRMALMAGNATAAAAREVRRRAIEAASDLLEASPADLEIVDGNVRVRGVPTSSVALGELARWARRRANDQALVATQAFAPERPTAYAGGAHACLVEVDIETGWVHVLRYIVVHDCGTLINPTVVEGQIHGGVVHGLGNVLSEMMVYDGDGKLETGTFAGYAMPRAEYVPTIEVHHHESPSPNNPEGIKGAGEGGTIGALATILGAIEDALAPLNAQLHTLPLKSQDLARICAPLRS